MMKLLNVMLLLFATLAVISCNKDDDGAPNTDKDDFFECKIDGTDFRQEGLYAYATPFSTDTTLAVYGSENPTEEDYTLVYVFVKDDMQTGTYTLGPDSDAAGYIVENGGNATFLTFLEGGSGSIEVTEVDDERIKGTFNFVAVDDNGNTRTVTDGSFDVSIRE